MRVYQLLRTGIRSRELPGVDISLAAALLKRGTGSQGQAHPDQTLVTGCKPLLQNAFKCTCDVIIQEIMT